MQNKTDMLYGYIARRIGTGREGYGIYLTPRKKN
jgi:hypothetical protein